MAGNGLVPPGHNIQIYIHYGVIKPQGFDRVVANPVSLPVAIYHSKMQKGVNFLVQETR